MVLTCEIHIRLPEGKTVPFSSIGPSILRWLARILSVLLLAFIGMFVVGEAHCDMIGVLRGTHGMCLAFPLGLCVGLFIAWWWELTGSLVSLMSLVVYYVGEFLQAGRPFRGIGTLLILAAPALLFLASWAWWRMSYRPGPAGKQ